MSNHTIKSSHHISFENNITASTTQTQAGGTALTAHINTINTVANDNDAVVLLTIKEGDETNILNDGVKILQIFPASGNDLGNGLNISMILESNERIKFYAKSDTEWDIEDSTEIFHTEMHDEDNTDAFVISKVNENHCYHSNGIILGDVVGWKFDNGGTAAIASIADGSAGEITVTTTGSHNLAVGDIVSQTNLTDSNYVGIFIVNTITDTTHYKVTATWGVTGTGTMDKASTLTCNPNASGAYALTYDLSGTSEINNDIFKFFIYKNTTKIAGTKRKRKFSSTDEKDVTKGTIVHIDGNDKILMVLKNTTGAGNITLEDQDVRLIRL